MALPLNPIALQPRGHYSQNYQAALPSGVTIEDAEKPEFWAKVCARPDQHGRVFLRPFDRIEVIPEDGSCFAEFIVLTAGVGYAKIKKILRVDLEEADMRDDAPRTTRVAHSGFGKWRVERVSDGIRLKEGLASKAEAERHALEYERVTAKAA